MFQLAQASEGGASSDFRCLELRKLLAFCLFHFCGLERERESEKERERERERQKNEKETEKKRKKERERERERKTEK